MEKEIRYLEKEVRNLYEERTGKKWRPDLKVIQGGCNTTPISRKVSLLGKRKP
jgi:hypothetical protein